MQKGANSILGQIEIAKEFRDDTLKEDLQVDDSVINGSERSEAERGYAEWLQRGEEGWYGMHVKTIPCIYVGTRTQVQKEGGDGWAD